MKKKSKCEEKCQIIENKSKESEKIKKTDENIKNNKSDYEEELSAIDSDDSYLTKEFKQKNKKKGK